MDNKLKYIIVGVFCLVLILSSVLFTSSNFLEVISAKLGLGDVPGEPITDELLISRSATSDIYELPGGGRKLVLRERYYENTTSGEFIPFDISKSSLSSDGEELTLKWYEKEVKLQLYVKDKSDIKRKVKDLDVVSKQDIDLQTSINLQQGKTYRFNHTLTRSSQAQPERLGYDILTSNVDCEVKGYILYCDEFKLDLGEAVKKQGLNVDLTKTKAEFYSVNKSRVDLSYIDPTWTLDSSQTICGEVTNYTVIEITNNAIINVCQHTADTNSSHTDTGNGYVNLTGVLQTLTIEEGAVLNATGSGFDGGTVFNEDGWGLGGGTGANGLGGGGGGYGATGGDSGSSIPGGGSYGSAANVSFMGSGAGSDDLSPGGNGGGLIMVNASVLIQINGTLESNGDAGSSANAGGGGGSGGGIWLIAQTIDGVGTVQANGGDGGDGSADGGSGAGGRIYIQYATNTSLFTTSVTGGTAFGSATQGGTGSILWNNSVPSSNNAPVINSNFTSPLNPTLNDVFFVYANVTDPDGNDDIQSVLFSIIAPNGTRVVNSVNGTLQGVDNWSSLSYTVLDQGTWTWTINATDGTGTDTDIGYFTVDTIDPTITIVNLSTIYSSPSVDLNYTYVETNPDTCWYSLDNGVTNTSFSSCGDNATITANLGLNNVYVYINDTSGLTGQDNQSFLVLSLLNTFNDSSVLETTNTDFAVEVYNSTSTLTSAVLTYNNTEFVYDSFESNGTSLWVNKTLSIPLVNNDTIIKQFYWNLTFNDAVFGEVNVSSTIGTQVINQMNFVDCVQGTGTQYLNFSFANETSPTTFLDARVQSATFTYSGNSARTPSRSFTYFNTTDHYSYAYCFTPDTETIYTNIDFNYLRPDAPQRKFNQNLTLTNISTNLTLYYLTQGKGQFVSFNVINVAEQALTDVSVIIQRVISGNLQNITQGYTDSTGTFTAFLDFDDPYTFTFSKKGYSDLTQSFTPAQTSYTITLGGATSNIPSTNYFEGMNWSTYPGTGVLSNNTNYSFAVVTQSSVYSLTETGFTLTNTSGAYLGGATCSTSSGCNASSTINTGNNTRVFMEYYWLISGNSTNLTTSWDVTVPSTRTSSVDNLVSDINIFGRSFGTGINAQFTRAILGFLIILVVVAGSARLSGGLLQQNRAALLIQVVVITFIIEFLGFMPDLPPNNPRAYFVTIFISLLVVADLVHEWLTG